MRLAPVESTAPTFSDPPSHTDGCQRIHHPPWTPVAADTIPPGRLIAPHPGHRGPDIRRNASKTQPRQVRDLRLRHSLSFPRATFPGGCHRWALCPPAPPSNPSRGNTGCRPHVTVCLCLLADGPCASRGAPYGQNPLATRYRGGLDGTTTDTHPCAAEPCFSPALQARTPLGIVAICASLPCTALSPSSSTYCAPRGGPLAPGRDLRRPSDPPGSVAASDALPLRPRTTCVVQDRTSAPPAGPALKRPYLFPGANPPYPRTPDQLTHCQDKRRGPYPTPLSPDRAISPLAV